MYITRSWFVYVGFVEALVSNFGKQGILLLPHCEGKSERFTAYMYQKGILHVHVLWRWRYCSIIILCARTHTMSCMLIHLATSLTHEITTCVRTHTNHSPSHGHSVSSITHAHTHTHLPHPRLWSSWWPVVQVPLLHCPTSLLSSCVYHRPR